MGSYHGQVRTYRYAKGRKEQTRITGTLKTRNKTRGSGVARMTKSKNAKASRAVYHRLAERSWYLNTKTLKLPTLGESTETRKKTKRGGKIMEHTKWRNATHSTSEGRIGIGKPHKKKDKSKARSRGREAGAAACEMSPTLSAL